MFYVQVNDGINENGQLDQVRNFLATPYVKYFLKETGRDGTTLKIK